MNYAYFRHRLRFKIPGGTSRGVLRYKDSWILYAREEMKVRGIGECSIIPGLSPDVTEKLVDLFDDLSQFVGSALSKESSERLKSFPAARFALETLNLTLSNGNPFRIAANGFTDGTEGIPINGLVWMGTKDFMMNQIREKLDSGYRCIKIKIGAIDFEDECDLLRFIRSQFSKTDIELRVDANGAFMPGEANDKLGRLAEYDLHSIEQPIATGHWEEMARLCQTTPLPIALDEELIGVESKAERRKLLETIGPQYIILKPSLIGGLAASEDWIGLAKELGVDWWVTSALESNIGLNAIAQWTHSLSPTVPQGLGTGQLFTNNISSPLTIHNGHLFYNPGVDWDLNWMER